MTAVLVLAPAGALAQQSCSKLGDPCCSCEVEPGQPLPNDICMWSGTAYCEGLTVCNGDSRTCVFPDITVDPSADSCGKLNAACCVGVVNDVPRPSCVDSLVCASGSCLDPSVVPAAPSSDNECFGRWKECGEDQICRDLGDGTNGRCESALPAVDDSSVRGWG